MSGPLDAWYGAIKERPMSKWAESDLTRALRQRLREAEVVEEVLARPASAALVDALGQVLEEFWRARSDLAKRAALYAPSLAVLAVPPAQIVHPDFEPMWLPRDRDFTIGAAGMIHLHLDGKGIAREHLKIRCDQRGYTALPLGTSFYLNGREVSEPQLLKAGDVLKVGTHELRFVEMK